jgi:hypothetical protein
LRHSIGCVERDGGGCRSETEAAARNSGIVGKTLVNEVIAHAVETSCLLDSIEDGRGFVDPMTGR